MGIMHEIHNDEMSCEEGQKKIEAMFGAALVKAVRLAAGDSLDQARLERTLDQVGAKVFKEILVKGDDVYHSHTGFGAPPDSATLMVVSVRGEVEHKGTDGAYLFNLFCVHKEVLDQVRYEPNDWGIEGMVQVLFSFPRDEEESNPDVIWNTAVSSARLLRQVSKRAHASDDQIEAAFSSPIVPCIILAVGPVEEGKGTRMGIQSAPIEVVEALHGVKAKAA